MNKEEKHKLIKILIKKLEKNIDKYCGDWGTIDHRVKETFIIILNLLKVMNDENPFTDWYLEELLEDADE